MHYPLCKVEESFSTKNAWNDQTKHIRETKSFPLFKSKKMNKDFATIHMDMRVAKQKLLPLSISSR